MSANNELDVVITSKPSEDNQIFFEISSADAAIGSGFGFVRTSENFDESILTDYLELSVVMGGANPYKWNLRPDDPNRPKVNWEFIATIKKGGKTGQAKKTYPRAMPHIPTKNSISIIHCIDKLIIGTNLIKSPDQKLVLDTQSTDRDLFLRIVNDGTGTYPYEYPLFKDGVIHSLSINILNGNNKEVSEEITYLR